MRDRLPYLTLAAFGCAIALVLWHDRLSYPIDDTFITFRYAENLAAGYGLVWNPGGSSTEGYTNFLYVLLLVPFAWLDADLLVASQTINVVAVLASAIYIAKLARSLSQPEHRWLASVPAFLFLATPATWANALSGMETVVFGALVLAACYYLLEARRYIGYILFFLASLTRPEGAAIAAVATAVLLLGRERSSILRAALVGFVLPLAIYYVSKRLYFGHWLPNSFAVKVVQAVGEEQGFLQGLQAVKLFLLRVWPLLIVAVVPMLFARSIRYLAVFGAVLIIIVAYAVPAPLMGFFDRFFHSSEVLLFALAGAGVLTLATKFGVQQSLLAAGVIVTLLGFSNTQSPRAKEILSWDLKDINHRLAEIADDLRTLPQSERLTFATSDAGIMPYRSGMPHLDLAGLNETAIAHASTDQEVVDRILEVRPELILLSAEWSPIGAHDTCRVISRRVHGKLSTAVDRLLEDKRFAEYQPVAAYTTGVYDYAVLLDTRSSQFAALDSAYRVRLSTKSSLLTRLTCIR